MAGGREKVNELFALAAPSYLAGRSGLWCVLRRAFLPLIHPLCYITSATSGGKECGFTRRCRVKTVHVYEA